VGRDEVRQRSDDVTTDPEELDPELDVELAVDDDELDDELEDALPDGFGVEGEDEDDAVTTSDDETDADVPDVIAPALAAEDADTDDFEEDLATVVAVPEEEDEVMGRRAGEFICTRCFLVKKDTQLAVRSRKVCRDCA
jgi:hypothetical protein